MRLGVLATHPIQYQAPLFRALADRLDLHVYFAHQPSAEEQGADFGVPFTWDVPLLDGYRHTFLPNRAARPSTQTFGGCDTPEVGAVLRRERFDAFLVMGWYNKSLLQGIVNAWQTRTPLLVRGDSQLVTPRSPLKRIAKEAVYRQFIPRFDGYLVVGERARDYYRHYGADPARMFFVPHYVDNDWFAARAAASDAGALRREMGVGEGTLVMLFVGKLIPKKKPGDVIEAAARLRAGGADAHVALVGSGGLEPDLRAQAERLDVPVHFAGFKNQSELPPYYAGADVLVLPSDGGETWGLVVNEAMACGLPAVVSDAVGCGPDLVVPGETGAVFPVGQPEALAAAVRGLRPRLGTPALASALDDKMQVYALDTAVKGTLAAVRTVGRGGTRRRRSAGPAREEQ